MRHYWLWPAGMTRPKRARRAQLSLSTCVLEKTDHLSDTIYRYQHGKAM